MSAFSLAQFTGYLAAVWLIPAAGFLVLWLTHRSERYLGIWAAGMVTLEMNSLLILFRANLPEVSILISNLLLHLGHLLLILGCCSAFGARRFVSPSILFAIVFSIASTAVFFLFNTYENRVLVGGVAIAVYSLFLVGIVIARWAVVPRAAAVLILVTMSTHALVSLNRTVAVILEGHGIWMSLADADKLFFPETMIAVFGGSTAFFLVSIAKLSQSRELELFEQRTLAENLKTSLQEQNDLRNILLHELKRPINTAMAGIEAAKAYDLNKVVGAELSKSQISLLDAATYLNELSAASEIEELIAEKNFVRLSASAIAADLRSKWSIETFVSPEAEVCSIIGDEVLLNIALGNLIDNAQKYGATKNGCALFITCSSNYVRIDVVDDGPGIDTNDRGRVWLKYVRAPSQAKIMIPGSGLGLHIVRLIVEAHGGKCSIPDIDRSTVRVEFPLVA